MIRQRLTALLFLASTLLSAGAVSAAERPPVGPGGIDIGALPVGAGADELLDLLCSEMPIFCAPAQSAAPLINQNTPGVATLRSVLGSYLLAVPAVQLNGTDFFDVLLLVREGAGGEMILTLMEATRTSPPAEIGATFSTATGNGLIPEVELEGDGGVSGAVALAVEAVAGSAPLQLRVATTTTL